MSNIKVEPTYDGWVKNGYIKTESGGRGGTIYEWIASPVIYPSEEYFVVGVANIITPVVATVIDRGFLDLPKTRPYRFQIKQQKLYLYVYTIVGSVTITAKKLANLASSYSAADLYDAIASGAAYSNAVNVPAADTWMEIPLNALAISDMVANNRISIGFKASNEATGDNWAAFWATEHASNIPYMNIIGRRLQIGG